jgi:pSer/pThr/pTyr-binding forkhead associated (FHA) protein
MATELLVIAGPDEGRLFPLEEGDALSLGRGRSAAVSLCDSSVSPLHCRVRVHRNQVLVADLDSECGTFVNGNQVMSYKLRPGDVLRIGQTHFCLLTGGPEDSRAIRPVPTPSAESVAPTGAMHEMVGKSLNRYELHRLVATGRLGGVFQALDTKGTRSLLSKSFRPESSRLHSTNVAFAGPCVPSSRFDIGT